jgi:hypothetical protein
VELGHWIVDVKEEWERLAGEARLRRAGGCEFCPCLCHVTNGDCRTVGMNFQNEFLFSVLKIKSAISNFENEIKFCELIRLIKINSNNFRFLQKCLPDCASVEAINQLVSEGYCTVDSDKVLYFHFNGRPEHKRDDHKGIDLDEPTPSIDEDELDPIPIVNRKKLREEYWTPSQWDAHSEKK